VVPILPDDHLYSHSDEIDYTSMTNLILLYFLQELLQRVNLPGSFIGDIAVGNVLQPGQCDPY
jgi:hypothetical protein